jgi:hypothetical protein
MRNYPLPNPQRAAGGGVGQFQFQRHGQIRGEPQRHRRQRVAHGSGLPSSYPKEFRRDPRTTSRRPRLSGEHARGMAMTRFPQPNPKPQNPQPGFAFRPTG